VWKRHSRNEATVASTKLSKAGWPIGADLPMYVAFALGMEPKIGKPTPPGLRIAIVPVELEEGFPRPSQTRVLTSWPIRPRISPMGKIGRPRKEENVLARWIDRNEKGDREKAAKDLGITRVYLDRLCRGERRPSLALALKIEAKTGIKVAQWGEVAPHSTD